MASFTAPARWNHVIGLAQQCLVGDEPSAFCALNHILLNTRHLRLYTIITTFLNKTAVAMATYNHPIPSLSTLADEIMLSIFEYSASGLPMEEWSTQLGNLRLTCKTFVRSANTLYFRDYYCLLWVKDGQFVQPKSIRLFQEKPEYAKLVRNV